MAQIVISKNSDNSFRKHLSDSACKPTLPNSSYSDEYGASMVEYALLAAMVALIVFAALQQFGLNLSTQFSTISSKVAAG